MTNALLGLVAKLRGRGRALEAEFPDEVFKPGETVFDEIADELEAVHVSLHDAILHDAKCTRCGNILTEAVLAEHGDTHRGEAVPPVRSSEDYPPGVPVAGIDALHDAMHPYRKGGLYRTDENGSGCDKFWCMDFIPEMAAALDNRGALDKTIALLAKADGSEPRDEDAALAQEPDASIRERCLRDDVALLRNWLLVAAKQSSWRARIFAWLDGWLDRARLRGAQR